MSGRPRLPIDEVLPSLVGSLTDRRSAVVVAAPGSGKTTGVPPALLQAPWNHGRVLLVEPRRVAARSAAQRMAQQLGERVGGTVGLRMRHETVVSASTRLEVVTEGVLVRMLRHDPGLEGVSTVVLDEFHERSLDADLSLALLLDVRTHLRADLRLVVMSATLDVDEVGGLLSSGSSDDVVFVDVPHRLHPVTVEHRPLGGEPLADGAARVALEVAMQGDGDVLVFLPGVREIRRAQRQIDQRADHRSVVAMPLHGRLDAEATSRALAPARAGERRIILATTIAQTSITIQGVTTVVDGGLQRAPRRDPSTGMSRLATVGISRATAEQRTGRAGRTAPGRCVRLWSRVDERAMSERDRPEILDADLSDLALRLAAWGTEAGALRWCDPPSAEAMGSATALLRDLGAVDRGGRITPEGEAMADLPLPPRLARLLTGHDRLAAPDRELAVALAAVLGESDVFLQRGPADVGRRISALFGPESSRPEQGEVDPQAVRTVRKVRAELRQRAGLGGPAPTISDTEACGVLLARCFPDRIAVHRADRPGWYELDGDLSVRLPDGDLLTGEPLLVAIDVDADRRSGRINVAAPVRFEPLRSALGDVLRAEHHVGVEAGGVRAHDTWTIGGRVIARTSVPASADDVVRALLDDVRVRGLGALTWDDHANRQLARLQVAHRARPERWPDPSPELLLSALDGWLGAELQAGAVRHLDAVRVDRALHRLADTFGGRAVLDRLAPDEVTLGSGVTRRVTYVPGEPPRVPTAVRDLYGTVRTPTVGEGRVTVVLELLSPAGRPVAVTDDLDRFWSTGYPDVRKDMRGRYPRHHWPEDPRTAEPRPPRPRRP